MNPAKEFLEIEHWGDLLFDVIATKDQLILQDHPIYLSELLEKYYNWRIKGHK